VADGRVGHPSGERRTEDVTNVTHHPPAVVAGTDPYPWPWDADLRPDRLAVVVCGVQRIHAEASIDVRSVLERIDEVSVAARRAGGIVCHVRHSSPTMTKRPLLPRIGDQDWAPIIRPAPDDLLVSAGGHDGFCSSSLDLELRARGRDLVVAVGLASEVTVSGTVRSANDRGYECLTLVDATAPLSVPTGQHELHSVTMSGGIFGAVGSTDDLLGALRAPARTEAQRVPVPQPREEHP
jgi:nicotinamidase-related amidase